MNDLDNSGKPPELPAIHTSTTGGARQNTTDALAVIVFPPALLLGTLVLGIVLNLIWPLHFPRVLWARVAGGVLFLLGGVLLVWGRQTMVRAGTNVPPHLPALTIVTDGPFRFTRNPLYVGGTAAYLGLSLCFNLAWLLVLLIPMLLLLSWGIVKREEQYLENKFGETYLAYKASVRRWL